MERTATVRVLVTLKNVPASTEEGALAWAQDRFEEPLRQLRDDGVRYSINSVEAEVDGPGGEIRGGR